MLIFSVFFSSSVIPVEGGGWTKGPHATKKKFFPSTIKQSIQDHSFFTIDIHPPTAIPLSSLHHTSLHPSPSTMKCVFQVRINCRLPFVSSEQSLLSFLCFLYLPRHTLIHLQAKEIYILLSAVTFGGERSARQRERQTDTDQRAEWVATQPESYGVGEESEKIGRIGTHTCVGKHPWFEHLLRVENCHTLILWGIVNVDKQTKKICSCVLSEWWEWFGSTNTPHCFQRALTASKWMWGYYLTISSAIPSFHFLLHGRHTAPSCLFFFLFYFSFLRSLTTNSWWLFFTMGNECYDWS